MTLSQKKTSLLFLPIIGLLAFSNQGFAQTNELRPWKEGYLDIHHISTGRGNATFILFPDGTSFVIDCGDMSETHSRVLSERNTPIVPDHSRTPAQWVADYIFRVHPKGADAVIDYALITHFHDDHFGEADSLKKQHKKGGYLLTGITELGSIIPIKKIIDRGYDFPVNFKDPQIQEQIKNSGDTYSMIKTLEEYWKFIDYQSKTGNLCYEKFRAGSSSQITMKYNPAEFPGFVVKNLFANGEINGRGGELCQCIKQGEYHGENELSAGIRISYGDFDYYTGGDIGGNDSFGQTDMKSMESKVAPLIGAVDVATLNHHGNRGSMNTYFVSCLRPSVWIQQTWSSDHPGAEVLRRITSKELYPGDRDIFTNALLKSNRLVLGSDVDKSYKSVSGHIVIRVYPDGKTYSVFVLNDQSSQREVLSQFDYMAKPCR